MDQDAPPPGDGQIPPYVPTPPPGTPPPGMGPPGVYVYPEESQAVLSLVLSIVGLVVCGGILCPVGWYLANKDIAAIDAGRRDPSKRDIATAGKVIGIVGTLLVVLAIVAVIGFVVLAIGLSATA